MVDHAKLFFLSPNPYVLLDPTLTMVEMNDAYCAVTMHAREDLVGRKILDVFPSDPASEHGRQLRASFRQVLETGKRDVLPLIRYAIPRPDGVMEDRYWSATHTPILNDDGSVRLILQHTVDVTELHRLRQFARRSSDFAAAGEGGAPVPPHVEMGVLHRAEEAQARTAALGDQHRRLLSLLEQAPGFMAVLSGPHHVFELANAAYRSMLGHRPLVGLRLTDAIPEIHGQGFAEVLDQVVETARPFSGTGVAIMLKRGDAMETRYLDFIYQPILGEDGSVQGVFVQGHDVTEQTRAIEQRRRAEIELRELNDRLEREVEERTQALHRQEQALHQAQKMEAIGKLTGGVAHDFNNLLQVIAGNLHLLSKDVSGVEQAERRLQHALAGVTRGAKLASHLLAFGRRQSLEPKVINIGRFVRGMDELLRRTLGEEVELKTIVEDSLWNTLADPTQVETALLNLAINARDAMDGRGRLTIEARNADLADFAEWDGGEPGPTVMIAVSDTGGGMIPEVLERAFEPFFTTKPEGKGSGLGLSMVYGFIKQSGGHVKIDSEPGGGTTVRLYLPRTRDAEDVDVDADVGPIVGGTETILVVEDDDEVRRTVVEMLADLGYAVVEARDAEAGLAIVDGGAHVDLLFTDVIMPGPMRSPELAERARERLPSLAVLFTSGYAENAIVHGGRLDPGVELLGKPYSRVALARRIRQVLRAGPAAQARPPRAPAIPEPPSVDDGPIDRAPAGALCVLLVEDEPLIRLHAADMLAELGYVVVEAGSMREARAMLAGEAVDLLVTDVGLPDGSGLALAVEARKLRPGIPVVLATGHSSAPGAEDKVPGHRLLAKPYDLAQLRRVLSAATADGPTQSPNLFQPKAAAM